MVGRRTEERRGTSEVRKREKMTFIKRQMQISSNVLYYFWEECCKREAVCHVSFGTIPSSLIKSEVDPSCERSTEGKETVSIEDNLEYSEQQCYEDDYQRKMLYTTAKTTT